MVTTAKVVICICIVYLYAIMPRLPRRDGGGILHKGQRFTHRGLHGRRTGAPENSLAAFQKAVEAGCGIELDVQLTRDGVPVVHHDFSLKRMCGEDVLIADLTLEELKAYRLRGIAADTDCVRPECGGNQTGHNATVNDQGEYDQKVYEQEVNYQDAYDQRESVPTLQEVLDLVDGKVPLLVEIKSETADLTICRRTDKVLAGYSGAYCVESFNPLVLLWYRIHRSKVLRGQLSDNFRRDPAFGDWKHKLFGLLLTFLVTDILSRPDFIAYNWKYENNISRRICRGLFRGWSAAWTIQSEEQLIQMSPHFDIFIFENI